MIPSGRIISGILSQQSISAGGTEYSLWGATTVGAENIDPAEPHIVIGTKFKTNTNGQITAIRFQRISGYAGATSVALFQGSTNISGTQATSGLTASGWQRQNFSSGINITSGTIYTAAILTPGLPSAYYATASFFNSARVQGPLTGVATSESANGVYLYSESMTAPTSTFNAACYYVDVVFVA